MVFHETTVGKPKLQKNIGSANFYVHTRKRRIVGFLVVPIVIGILGHLANLFFLLAGGSLLTCLFIGWILGERKAAKKYIESVQLRTKLIEVPKRTKEEDFKQPPGRNEERVSKEEIAKLYKLLEEGRTVKGMSVGTLGFLAWLELSQWIDKVKKVTGEICGKDSIEYLLVPTAHQAPRCAIDEAIRRTQVPNGSEVVNALLEAFQNPAALFRGELPGGAFRLSSKLRDIIAEAVMDAIRTVIKRLKKGYGPLRM